MLLYFYVQEDRLDIKEIAQKAKDASRKLASLDTGVKNQALKEMANALEKEVQEIKNENQKDLEFAKNKRLSKALIDRLTLNDKRIKGMADDLREIAKLNDPIGEIIEETVRPNGLKIKKIRVPLGVVGIIYESRPNVTADATGLCLKSGNSVILRGGSEAINSNICIAKILEEAAKTKGVPDGAIQLIESTDREKVVEMIKLSSSIDVIIPRGSEEMIENIRKNATVPVITHGKGLCHTYVDKDADLKMAEEICFNAKVQRPGVCNAMETLLVHREIAKNFLPSMIKRFEDANVEIRGDERTKKILSEIKLANEEDWNIEYLDLILSVKIVDSIQEAVGHINKYGSGHSETIITKSEEAKEKFLKEVDAAAVFHNASTRFTDGSQFGMGAEIGISTQKFHARGPMGLRELTSYKFLIYGNGQIRT